MVMNNIEAQQLSLYITKETFLLIVISPTKYSNVYILTFI